ncbi:MAG: type II secretion system protein GspD [Verrucomicrobiia bacterium]|jgi:type IV pilus assembly protein PilQ
MRKLTSILLVAGIAAMIVSGCRSVPDTDTKVDSKRSRAKSGAASGRGMDVRAARTQEKPERIKFSEQHDAEIREVLRLASDGEWESAETMVARLANEGPDDLAIERLYSWVSKQRELRRSQALEDRIREIDAKNSVFNSGVIDLLKEKKNRGLPAKKDLRDAIQAIESTRLVPESFGTTVVRKGRLFDLETERGSMAKALDKRVTVQLDDVTLESIIFDIGEAEGINFIADKSLPAFKEKLSVNMGDVKLSEFLRYVSRNMDLHFQVSDDLVWVVDGSKTNLLEETRFYRLQKGFVVPAQFGASQIDRTSVTSKAVTTVTEKEMIEKFVQDGAPDLPSIETAIELFYKGSEFMIDYERNLIVARGNPEQLEVLEKIIEEFDRPIQQVFIEARFVTVTEAVFQQLGASWETGRGPGRSQVKDFTSVLDPDAAIGLGLEESFTSVLGRDNLSLTMTALEQSGESQTLSAPRLTLINNRPARISDGKVQYYYEEYTVSQQINERSTASSLVPQGKPISVTAGVSLDVVASIGGDGESIMLALHPEVNQEVKLVTFATVTDRDLAGNVISSFDIRLPESRTQEISTRVIVKSGQTVVMGGVLERSQLTFVESVPILGNIPIIGAAFRKRTEADKPRYLLIFVTATLLSDSGEFVVFEESKPTQN